MVERLVGEIGALTRRYPHQRDLHLTASRMCGLVGALYTDLAHDQAARDWLHTADRYATLSGDTAQRYWVAMARAMTAYYAPAPQRVITIAEHALGTSTTALAAQLTGLAARAHASLGHTERASRQLDKAHSIFADLTAAQADEPFWGFPQREMRMYSSQVHSRTGTAAAWDEQEKALSAYPADDPMDRPLILLDRARFLTGQGDHANAGRVASDAINALPADLRVPLLITQVREVAALIAPRAPAAARELRESVTSSA